MSPPTPPAPPPRSAQQRVTARAAARRSDGGDGARDHQLLGALVDPSTTAAAAASRPERCVLTRALFPERVVVFDVETTGFAQDDVSHGLPLRSGLRFLLQTSATSCAQVIVEIGAVELIGTKF